MSTARPPLPLSHDGAPSPDEAPGLYAVARACLDESATIEIAAAALLDACSDDATLMAALMRNAAQQRAVAVVRAVASAQRRAVWTATAGSPAPRATPPGVTPLPSGQLARMARRNVERLLDGFRLPRGTRLRDAGRVEIVEAEALYRSQSATMAGRAEWLALIAQGLTENQTVGQRYSEARLVELQHLALAGPNLTEKSATPEAPPVALTKGTP